MNKKLLVLPLVALLAGCSANKGPVYTETTKQEFDTKQEAAQQALLDLNEEGQYFIGAKVTGSIKENSSYAGEHEYALNVTFTYTENEETGSEWINDAGDETIESYAEQYFFYMAGTFIWTIDALTVTESELKYYTSDAGFKVQGAYKATMGMDMDMTVDVESMEYVFNEYAMATSIKSKASSSMKMGGTTYSSTAEVDIQISYTHR